MVRDTSLLSYMQLADSDELGRLQKVVFDAVYLL